MKYLFLKNPSFKLFIPGIILLTALAAPAVKSSAPFQSTEKITYVAEKTDPLIGLFKSEGFQGTIARADFSAPSLRLVDDYLIDPGSKKIDTDFCKEALSSLLGPHEGAEAVITLKDVETFKGRYGNACEIQAADVKEAPSPKRYRALIFKFKDTFRAFVTKGTLDKPSDGESSEFRKFLSSLR